MGNNYIAKLLICSYSNIYIVGLIVEFFTSYKPGHDLSLLYFYIFGLGISSGIVAIIRTYTKRQLGIIGNKVFYRAKVEGFERLMEFSLKWHQEENSGAKVQKIQSGSNSLKMIMSIFYQRLYDVFISIIGIGVIFIFLSPLFLSFLILYIASLLLTEGYFYKKTYAANQQFNSSNERSSGTYYESASNVLTIKTLGMKEDVKSKVQVSEESANTHSNVILKLGTIKWRSFNLLNAAFSIIFLLIVSNEFITGAIAIGSIFVYYSYFSRLTQSTTEATQSFNQLIENKASLSRMIPLYFNKTTSYKGTKDFPSQWNNIRISDGNFKYTSASAEFTIQNIHLDINKYEKIGIVGHSGSGKSTLAKLLLGLYELESGTFTIGKTNFYDIQHTLLTRHISTVLQETELFNFSLRENITMMKDIPVKQLQKAIEISQLESIIDQLPLGLDTLIGEKGYKLSGGERQRIGIARAICANPEILILDEATSALDSKTEALIQEALEKRLTKKTLIIIAHRLSTLRGVDKIYVFEKGTIVEQGTFDELKKDKTSRFSQMYELQIKNS